MLTTSGNNEDDGHDERAPPEAAAHTDEVPHAREQQAGEEGVEQARNADEQLVGREAPSADHGVGGLAALAPYAEPVDVEAEQHRHAAEEQDTHRQGLAREAADDERVEDVGQVFPLKRPHGTVEGIGLSPPADVHRGRQRDDRAAPKEHQYQHACRGAVYEVKLVAAGEVEERCAQRTAEDDHRMEAHKTPLEEIPRRHPVPAVVVGVADDKAGEREEKVDGEVAVIEDLCGGAVGVGLEEVKGHDDQGGHAA